MNKLERMELIKRVIDDPSDPVSIYTERQIRRERGYLAKIEKQERKDEQARELLHKYDEAFFQGRTSTCNDLYQEIHDLGFELTPSWDRTVSFEPDEHSLYTQEEKPTSDDFDYKGIPVVKIYSHGIKARDGRVVQKASVAVK